MLLSMWILRDELGSLCSNTCINDGSMTIEGFRVIADGEINKTNYLCIGSADGFFDAAPGATVLLHRSDYILIESIPFEDVLNAIIAIFDRFNTWERRLIFASHTENGFQNLLDTAHEHFNCPMFFGHKSRRIYAVTSQYTDKDVFEGWNLFKESMGVTEENYELMIRTAIGNNPAYQREWPNVPFKDRMNYVVRTPIRIKVIHGGELWGHLVLYRYEDDVSPSITQLASFVANIFVHMLDTFTSATKVNYIETYWIANAMRGDKITDSQTDAIKSFLKIDNDSSAILHVVRSSASDEDNNTSWFIERFEQYPLCRAFCYDGSIIAIETVPAGAAPTMTDKFKTLLFSSSFKCGSSLPFNDIRTLDVHYHQALYALLGKESSDEKVFNFRGNALAGVVAHFKENCDWRQWVIPELFDLINSDSNSENFKTLCEYLYNNGNLSEIAKKMFIHRNTLIYRIRKIESMLNVDLNDGDTCDYLKICCLMMDSERSDKN